MFKPKKSKTHGHSDERSYPNPYISDPEPSSSDYKVSGNNLYVVHSWQV